MKESAEAAKGGERETTAANVEAGCRKGSSSSWEEANNGLGSNPDNLTVR